MFTGIICGEFDRFVAKLGSSWAGGEVATLFCLLVILREGAWGRPRESAREGLITATLALLTETRGLLLK